MLPKGEVNKVGGEVEVVGGCEGDKDAKSICNLVYL
jgi:hypothetical protein